MSWSVCVVDKSVKCVDIIRADFWESKTICTLRLHEYFLTVNLSDISVERSQFLTILCLLLIDYGILF